MKKLLGILVLVIFSVVVVGTLSSCDSPQEDCYKKVYKMWKKRGNSEDSAVQNARKACY